MIFRKDINGLRAIAVIAVMLFHFNASWMPGGFAGVDVFFVISGFLMTGMIFTGIEQKNFSILKFYVARANRIIPALAFLCLALFLFGWFFLAPFEFEPLGKQIGSSMLFFSNIVYWRESGYFDVSSHGKWLLHTWSLSTEWQFYIIYPFVLVTLKKFFSLKAIKKIVLIGTVLGFIFCIIATYKWPNAAYYLLPTRAWEMMIGGVACLYPFTLKEKRKKLLEWIGVTFIIGAYFLISKDNLWPGYLAIFPVLGSFFILQAQRSNSLLTSNIILQKIGAWSYSIYLWHWPLVVAIYYFSLNEVFTYLGILLSILLGFLSNKYIEKIRFKNNFNNLFHYLKCKPIYLALIVGSAGGIVFIENGFIKRLPVEYRDLVLNAKPSPVRDKCHISEYHSPSLACEYFGEKISWATFGDSHTVELAYALAEKLKSENIGLKQFSFSGCRPSYLEPKSFSQCAEWYNETVSYILKNDKIKNIVFNHRFTGALIGGDANSYPEINTKELLITNEMISMIKHINELIMRFSENKENVYVFYPIPELPKNINKLIDLAYKNDKNLDNVIGTSLHWYEERNKYIINHFNNARFPKNVHLIDLKDVFCDQKNCFAVRDGTPLYIDSDHPSILGANRLAELIK